MKRLTLILTGCLLLAACSKAPTEEKPNVLLESQRAAMEKARQTEQVMAEAARKQREELEKEQQ